MVKTVSAKKRLLVALVAFAASLFMAAGLTFRARAEGESATQFRVKGASVRYVDNAYTPAVKFHVLLDKATFDGLSESAETGLKLCPTKLLNGESLATSESAQVVTKTAAKTDWKVSETDPGMMELVVFVYDIPATDYGTDIKVAGYITDGGKTTYTEAKNDTFSLAYVAKEAASLDSDKAAQLEGYYKFDFKAYDLSEKLIGNAQTVEYGSSLTQPAPSSVLTCGWYNKSKTQRWDFSADAVRGNVSLYEVEHTFNADGVCSLCGVTKKSKLISAAPGNNSTVTYMEGKGWEVKSLDGQLWYCTISSKLMKSYIDSGCTEMEITYVDKFSGVTNPNVGAFVNTKSRIIPYKAGGSQDWKYPSSYKYISALPLVNGGYVCTVDLTDSAYDFTTKDTQIVFENHDNKNQAITCGYIKDIKFINHADKSTWVSPNGANSAVTYMDGKGWEIKSTNGNGWECAISAKVIKHYVDMGYTTMNITYVNEFAGVTTPNVGAFVNTKSRIIPYKAGGGEDWTYNSLNTKFISGLPAGNGGYVCTVDLTDTAYDFVTKDSRIYFDNKDNKSNAVTCAYIKDIEFVKGTLPNA